MQPNIYICIYMFSCHNFTQAWVPLKLNLMWHHPDKSNGNTGSFRKIWPFKVTLCKTVRKRLTEWHKGWVGCWKQKLLIGTYQTTIHEGREGYQDSILCRSVHGNWVLSQGSQLSLASVFVAVVMYSCPKCLWVVQVNFTIFHIKFTIHNQSS